MIRTVSLMGTLVTIHVVGHGADEAGLAEADAAVGRAFGWFRHVEACCTRFDPQSELMQLTARVGVPVRASETLFEAVRFALAVAEASGGAFDPTVGGAMEARGFNRDYRTGQIVRSGLERAGAASYRDVRLAPGRQTITLLRPLTLDLGAVAKGLAVDMAARELCAFEDYAIDAGGDLYVAGCSPDHGPWSVGIRHPREDRQWIDALRVSDMAVCTSGDYERTVSGTAGDHHHHVLDPRTGASPTALASVTVVAPTAMVADALATAAFVLGPDDGMRLLERQGVQGLLVSPTLERYATQGFFGTPIFSNAERPAHHHPRGAGRHRRAG